MLLAVLAAAQAAEARPPAENYVLQCRGCHGPDGRGLPGQVPDLVDVMGRFLALPEGRAYLVRVPGTAHAPLPDDEIAALLNWMLARFSPSSVPEGAPPYTTEEVSAQRRRPLADPVRERARLVRELAAQPDRTGSRPDSRKSP